MYRNWCGSCHGLRGEGGVARAGIRRAPELSLSRPGATVDARQLFAAMGNEQHLTALEGRTLTDGERQAVVAYIRRAFIEPLGGGPRPVGGS